MLLPNQQYVEGLVGGIAVFALHLFNSGRFKTKLVADVELHVVGVACDPAHRLVVQHG